MISPESFSCDGFVEFVFKEESQARSVLDKALVIKELMQSLVEQKLSGEDVTEETSQLIKLTLSYYKLCVPVL